MFSTTSNSRLEPHVCMTESFLDQASNESCVSGFLHRAENSRADGLVLTHSAGGNCKSPLLVALAEALCGKGVTVLRCDLPFRQLRPHGPPLGSAEKDQEGIRRAVQVMRKQVSGRIFLGGHSYGGRMATMLCAREPSIADGLLLLSYPLHPPLKPQQLRTAHFPDLHCRALFVHGTRDPFGSIEEMEAALRLTSAETKLVSIDGAGHEVITNASQERVIGLIVAEFTSWLQQ
jgi:predicted alpha/beta-hydrolase family hydrolase